MTLRNAITFIHLAMICIYSVTQTPTHIYLDTSIPLLVNLENWRILQSGIQVNLASCLFFLFY